MVYTISVSAPFSSSARNILIEYQNESANVLFWLSADAVKGDRPQNLPVDGKLDCNSIGFVNIIWMQMNIE